MSRYRSGENPVGTEIATHAGITIYYNAKNEKFEAKVGRQLIERKDISALRTEIGRRTAHKVELMTDSGHRVTVVGMENGRWRRDDGELLRSYTTLYEYDESYLDERAALDAEYEELQRALNEKRRALRERLRLVSTMPDPPAPVERRRIVGVVRGKK